MSIAAGTGAVIGADALALLDDMRRDIPLTAAMRLAVVGWDGSSLILSAPLSPNINDKGTAFAGSLATLATVTGWALLTLWTRAQVGPCQVAVYHSELRYRRPVEAGFEAVAQLPDALALETLRQRLRQHGKGRVDVAVTVRSAGQDAVTLQAGYAVWLAPDAMPQVLENG